MTLVKAVFGRNKKGGEEFFSKKIRGAKTRGDYFFSTKKGGRRLFFRQIFPKTRPRYPFSLTGPLELFSKRMREA